MGWLGESRPRAKLLCLMVTNLFDSIQEMVMGISIIPGGAESSLQMWLPWNLGPEVGKQQ